MKIHPFSDLHIPHHIKGNNPKYTLMHAKKFLDEFIEQLPDADIYTIAGDFYDQAMVNNILRLAELLTYFAEQLPDKQIIYVPGNHEFYRTSKDGVLANKYESKLPKNLHWLEREIITIDGINFAGSTLWFPYIPGYSDLYKNNMNDFSLIYNFENWIYKENTLNQNFFKKAIKERVYHQNEKLVCLSHHLPCYDALCERWIGDLLNIYYVGSESMQHELGNKDITWFFGHSHDPVDRLLGETRVVCNPYGYYEMTPYNNKLIVEV